MKPIKTICPACGNSLEFDADAETVICAACSETFRVVRGEGGVALAAIAPRPALPPSPEDFAAASIPLIEQRLAEVDELLVEAEAEIEAVRSREQSGPLRIGCSVFAIFFTILLAIVLFGLAGREYVGGWLFYIAVALIIIVGVYRIRAKLAGREELERLRQVREEVETATAGLQAERDRLAELKSRIVGEILEANA